MALRMRVASGHRSAWVILVGSAAFLAWFFWKMKKAQATAPQIAPAESGGNGVPAFHPGVE